MTSVAFSRASDDDLVRLQLYLADRYVDFGEPMAEALERATSRVVQVRREIGKALSLQPFRGTLCEGLRDGLRQATIGRAVVYFIHDEAAGEVSVLAVFYGAQDHDTRIRERLLG